LTSIVILVPDTALAAGGKNTANMVAKGPKYAPEALELPF
jgi:hypothetical protein